jgi:glycosyltransferase involved in cell wall biosynthesis
MKVAIIEPFLRNEIGHYLSFVKELRSGFEALGDSVTVFLPFEAKVSLEGERVLPSLYEIDESKGYLKRVQELLRKIIYYKKNFSKISRKVDLMVITTANSYPILTALIMTDINCPVALYFHTMELIQSKISGLCKVLFNINSKKLPFLGIIAPFPVEKEKIKEKVSKKPIQVFPNAPYPFPEHLPFQPIKGIEYSNLFCLGYFGDARLDKNFPAIAQFALETSEKYSFIIQCHPPASGKYEPAVLEWITRLKAFPGSNFLVLEDLLEGEKYFSYFQRASAVFCLHDPRDFRNRVSAILFEAWFAGKPVIVLNGSWLAEQVRKFNGGIIVEDINTQTLEKAVEEIKANYGTYAREALEAGVALLKQNNGKSLAEFIKQKFKYFPKVAKE